MAFNNFYGGYPPYQQQGYYPAAAQDQLAQLRQGQYQQPAQQPSGNGMIWVQGESAARSFMVAPGNTVMLMDSDANTFYLKSADASGVPQPLRIFDYTERTAAPKTASAAPQAADYVTRSEFDALAARIDAMTAKEGPKPKKTVKEDTDNG